MTVQASEDDDHQNIIEPFDPQKHDRTSFSCGVEQVDNYFKKTANKLNKTENVRVFVLSTPSGEVIGFYALNAHSVSYTDLPAKYARSRPSHGDIPAACISMIGRSTRFRGNGYGADLLVDALRRIVGAADQLGLAVVMLDVLDCGNRERTTRRKALYESYGFRLLEGSFMRMFLSIATARQLVAEALDTQDSGEVNRPGFNEEFCSKFALPFQEHSCLRRRPPPFLSAGDGQRCCVASRYCTTQRPITRNMCYRRVLHEFHPWCGRNVCMESTAVQNV